MAGGRFGVGHLDIGVGQGGANVWNIQPAVQDFANIMAQQKARRDADNKQINDIVGSYDPTGLRNDADRQDAFKQYSDWKQQAINAENEKNPQKRAMAISQVREGFNRLQGFVGQSKKQGQLEQQIGMDLMKNRHNYTDDSIDRYKKSVQSGISSGDIINSPLDIERKVDPEKMDADYKKFKDSQVKPTQWDNGTISTTDYYGKKIGTRIQNRGVAMDGDNGAFHNMLNYVSSHDDFQKGLQDRYPNVQGSTQAETNALRTKQYMQDMGDSTGFYDTPKETHMEGEAPIRPSFRDIQYHKKFGIWPTGNESNTEQPAQALLTDMQNGVQGSGEKFKSLAPKGQYGNKDIGISIDPQTGEHVFQFPPVLDQKAKAENDEKRAKWAKENPGEAYDGDKLKPEIKLSAKTYRLNPASDNYKAQGAQMAAEQGINLDRYSKIMKGQAHQAQAMQQQSIHADPNSPKITFKTKDGKLFSIPFNKQKEFREQFPDAQIQN